MSVKKLKLGLLGKDVSKSLSGRIHCFILRQLGVDCEYEKISIPTGDFTGFDNAMRRLLGDFDGFNVTIPYKRDVIEYLNGVEGDAMAFSAVNTVDTTTGIGYNTDGVGFLKMVRAAGIEVKNKKILILGGGGAGRSTAVALKNAGAEVAMYQRRREKLLETCREIGITAADSAETGGFDILINCTGVGMHDSEGCSPVTQKAFEGVMAAIDLIYAPAESEFLRLAKEKGLKTLNGGAMLFYQAYYADCIYLKKQPDERESEGLYEAYLREYGAV